jgi:outer membrane protein assembly factor BamB
MNAVTNNRTLHLAWLAIAASGALTAASDSPSRLQDSRASASPAEARAQTRASEGWPEWRGPARDGVSAESGLPSSWSPKGENLLWRVPYGARSAPVVLNGRVYLQNTAGSGATEQERVLCVDTVTGKLLWERRYNIFMSDVPPHRLAWSSPAADPETGNVFAISGGGLLMALSPDGRLLWERSLAEEVGMWTTHGGRMSSPIVDGPLVIVSGITFAWGEHAGGAHRFIAFDKRTGQAVWMSAPEGRPTDTIYASPVVTETNGMRLFVSGGSDGAMHALKINTGEAVWHWLVSKRGLNTAALVINRNGDGNGGGRVIITHSEENIDTNEMGMIAAVPVASKGTLTDAQAAWLLRGVQAGYSSPVADGERLYQVDNGANLLAFDVKTGRQLWVQNLGTIQKSSPVLADGRLYVGTENGRFFIIEPGPTGAKILDQDWLGTEEKPEAIIASPAVADGRIFVASMDALYCIGRKRGREPFSAPVAAKKTPDLSSARPATTLLVTPTELILKPGESIALTPRAFDASGAPVAAGAATWALDGLKGTVADGTFTAAADGGAQAGLVKAAVAGVTGSARVRVIPPLPWKEDFETLAEGSVPSHWVNTRGKFVVRAVGGSKVLVKTADNPFAFVKRCRPFMGSPELRDYTIEADALALLRRRMMGDLGIVGQRYSLVLFGEHQRVELQSWQPETQRTVRADFAWKPDTWYRLKLRVDRTTDGKVRARGKVWARGDAEPQAWTIERIDSIGNLKGSPGLYADVPPTAEIFFDNIAVSSNGSQGSQGSPGSQGSRF